MELFAFAWSIHEEQHDRIRTITFGPADEGVHRPIGGDDIEMLLDHDGFSQPIAFDATTVSAYSSIWMICPFSVVYTQQYSLS